MTQNPSRQKRGGSLRALLPLFVGKTIIALQRRGAIMLYARCAYRGHTAPLTCSGQFMPHPTALVSMTGGSLQLCSQIHSLGTNAVVPQFEGIPCTGRRS